MIKKHKIILRKAQDALHGRLKTGYKIEIINLRPGHIIAHVTIFKNGKEYGQAGLVKHTSDVYRKGYWTMDWVEG